MDVHPTNAAAAESWDGPQGDFWTAHADRFDAAVARYTDRFLALAAIEPGMRVLDVGCGAGETARAAARLGARVTGVDLSSALLDVARQRAQDEGLDVAFVQADAQVADLGTDHDRVVSRTGVMFFGDPVAAFANLAGALRPDGRLVVAVWQAYDAQGWLPAFRTAIDPALPPPPPDAPGPFSLGDPEVVLTLLTEAGFAPPTLTGVSEPMRFGDDPEDADVMVRGIVGGMLDELDPDARAAAEERLAALLAAHAGPDGVTFPSAMWLVEARRR